MDLKIERRYLKKWDLFKLLIGAEKEISMKIGNLTLEKEETLILHPAGNMEGTIAVKVTPEENMLIALTPPNIQHNIIIKGQGLVFLDNTLKTTLAPMFAQTKKRKKRN